MVNGGWGGQTDGRTDGQTEGRTDGRFKISPCVLQEIGPLGPLPKKQTRYGEEAKTDNVSSNQVLKV